MSGMIKGIIAGIVVILIGAGLYVAAVAMNGWNWKLAPEFEMMTYETTGDPSSLQITLNFGEVKTEMYDGTCVKIEYPYASGYEAEAKEENGVVRFSNKQLKWYNFMSRFTSVPEVRVYIPAESALALNIVINAGVLSVGEGNYGKAELEVNAGQVKLQGVHCPSLNCTVNAGQITAQRLTCTDIEAEVNAGQVDLQICGSKADYTVDCKTDLGTCNPPNQSGLKEGYRIRAEVNVGAINLTFTE